MYKYAKKYKKKWDNADIKILFYSKATIWA